MLHHLLLLLWFTERTKPSFWPGNNILGVMLIDISNYIFEHPEEFPEDTMDTDNPSDNPSDLLNQHNRTDCSDNSDNSDSSDEDCEECDDEANKTVQEKQGKTHERQETQTSKSTHNEQTTQKTNADNTDRIIDTHSDGKKDATSIPKSKKKKKHHNKTMDTTTSQNTKDCRVGDLKSDIHQYLDPRTGKRKQLETTPEKSIEKQKNS